MSKSPALSGKQLIKALGKIGFEVTRIKGSHYFLEHIDNRVTVVPVHGKEIIGPGLLNKILKDCEITKETLAKLL